MSPSKDDLKNRLARVVLERVLEEDYLLGWIDTLGKLGAPPGKNEKNPAPPQARVSAAKTGVELVNKFIGDSAATEAGSTLLDALAKLDNKKEGASDPDTS